MLLRQGWTLTRTEQVEVLGSRQVSRDQVIQAAGLTLPLPLLTVEPQALGERLTAALPVEQVRVSRLMLPPRLRIDLVDRQAVARAQRRTPNGVEQGYVDRLGNWMSSRQQMGVPPADVMALQVVGWQERHRAAVARLLEKRSSFGRDLRTIRFEPGGSLWLDTTSLGASAWARWTVSSSGAWRCCSTCAGTAGSDQGTQAAVDRPQRPGAAGAGPAGPAPLRPARPSAAPAVPIGAQ